MSSTKVETWKETPEPNSHKLNLNSAILESLTTEQLQADALKENAVLRQELQKLRTELFHEKLVNVTLTRKITEAKVANSKLEKANDIKNIQNRLLNKAKDFLSIHPQNRKLNLFESLFSCFSPAEASVIEQARALDKELLRILGEGLESSLKSEISKVTKVLNDKHHKKRDEWLQNFDMGLKIQSYAHSLEQQLWSHRLISEFRNIVLAMATHDNKINMLKALKILENFVESDEL